MNEQPKHSSSDDVGMNAPVFYIAMHKNRGNLCLFAKWAIWEYFPQEKIEQLKGKFKGNIKICVPKTFFFIRRYKEEGKT